jgi:hypothetical protein
MTCMNCVMSEGGGGETEAVGSGSKYKLGVRHRKRISEEDQVGIAPPLRIDVYDDSRLPLCWQAQ